VGEVNKANATAAVSEEEPSAGQAPEGEQPVLSAEDARRAEQDRRDRRLVKRIRDGDEGAFQELVRTYQNRIYGLCYRFLGDREEAQDVAQDVFLKVFRAIETYRGDGRFFTWLYRIASNNCKNRIKYLKGRHHGRRLELEKSPQAQMPSREGGSSHSLQSQVPGPEASVTGSRLQRAIQEEIANLDADHRLLIVLRDIQGLSYHDIMKVTGLQAGTLKSRLHRARVALKKRMEKHMR